MPSKSVILVRKVDFGKGCKKIKARLSGLGKIEVRLDSMDAELSAQLSVKTEKWKTLGAKCSITGVHNLYFTLSGDVRFDSWQFE